MKKVLSTILAIVMLFTIAIPAFAAESNHEEAPHLDPLFEYADSISVSPQSDMCGVPSNRTEITGVITDSGKIHALVEKGLAECDENGKYPTKIAFCQVILTPTQNESELTPQSTEPAPVSITKSNYYDGQYFDEYDRYVVYGLATFSKHYSRTSTAGYNSNMSGEVTVGGKVYGVAEVKAALSASMGYTIGTSYTDSTDYSVNVPSGKYWVIKVWTSYRVFTYTAKVGSTQIATGKSWYPNGLVIKYQEYNS